MMAGTMLGASPAVAQDTTGSSGTTANPPAEAPTTPDSATPTSTEFGADIIVTAQKRSEAADKVPVTLQAIGGDDLQRAGIRDVKGVLALVPGASQSGETSAADTVYTIRGVSTGDTTGDATTASYLDDFAFSIPGAPFAPPSDLFDINRVEVLKGPQGTLYGSSSLGGVIKIVTNDPQFDKFEYGGAGMIAKVVDHSYNYSGDFMINVPLGDTLAIRGVITGKHTSGYAAVPALNLRDGNEEDLFVGRVKIKWQPSDKFSALASFWYFDDQQDFTNRVDGYDPPTINDIGFGESPSSFKLYTLKLNYQFGFADLTSTSGYIDRNTFLRANGKQVDTSFVALIPGDSQSFVQEVRLSSSSDGPFKWILGGFYQDGTRNQNQLFNLSGNGTTNPGILIDGTTSLNSKEYSAFGEISYGLFDGKLVPLVGLRYSSVDRVLGQNQTTTIQTTPPTVITSTGDVSGSNTHVSPRFNLSYYMTSNGMVYVNAAEGFRPGALQSGSGVAALQAVTGVVTPTQLATDSLWSYEVGTKQAFFDRTLKVNLSAYYIDWKSAQFQTGVSGVSGVINLGDVKGRGIEGTLSYHGIIPGLTTQIAIGWNKTTIDNIPPLVLSALSFLKNGGQLPNVPQFNSSLLLYYERPVFDDYKLIGDIRWDHRSTQSDLSTGLRSGTIDLTSANIGIDNGQYSISLFADNIFGEKGPLIWEQGRMLVPRPTTFGLRFTFGNR